MLDKSVVAKAGTLLLLDERTYVDELEVSGIYLIEKDFVPYDVLQDYLKDHISECDRYSSPIEHFVQYLTVSGYIREVAYDYWHVGSFGSFEKSQYIPWAAE